MKNRIREYVDQLYTSTDAYEVLSIPQNTFNWWIRQGVVVPKMPGRGKGSTNIFTLQQLWAIGIGRAVKAGGQSLETACQIARVLESFSPEVIEEAFAEGRTCLMVFNLDGKSSVVPYLTSPGAITDNEIIKAVRDEVENDGMILMWYGINTKPMLDQLIEHAKKQTARKPATSKRS